MTTIHITRRDGTKEPFNADMINKSIERATVGMTDPISKVMQVATDTRLTVYDGITTEQMDQATIIAAVQNIKDDLDYDKIATRLYLKTIYKAVLGHYGNDAAMLESKHREYFSQYIEEGINEGRLDKRLKDNFDLKAIAAALDLKRDELFQYVGISTVSELYLLTNKAQVFVETPQIFFMRVAMGLSYNEKDPTKSAIGFYDKMSRMEYIAGSSVNLGAGTTRPALANCFLMEVHDDMQHIAKSVADVMMLSKGSGGMGVSLTKLRATGSPLKTTNGVSSGPAPFAKIMDTSIRAIMRAGKRKGALCFYMENWHFDFPDFLEWKHNAGDDYQRMRTANTAAYISDEFMKRVGNGEDWYMFDPAETPDLNEIYGKVFSKRYAEYVQMAEEGKLYMFKKVPARELYRQMLVSLQTTSHPWQVWKDPINLRAMNNNTGTIHMSNLCTEICLPQDKENVAVCNLASLNLSTHISNKEINWQKLEETVRSAVRQLDNLIDINLLPIPEARKSDSENRAIGLGVMGLADVFEKIGIAYDSEAAYIFTDRIFEFISYMAIDESTNLAKERGAYKNFPGSRWSKGMVPIDTLEILEERRGVPLTVDKVSHHKGLNWDILREKVKGGIRNATLMAVAPNATIGLVAGTVPGIDGRFAQVFSRHTLSGKFLDLNHNLVKDLNNLGIWDEVKGEIIQHQGDLSEIEKIPQHIKDIYKTSFTTSPHAYIEVAARAQKWMDQALSRNIYLDSRDVDEMMDLYSSAWRKGLKSTYYLHMKPRHTAEQSTVAVNKSQKMGRKGFGAIAADLSESKEFKQVSASVVEVETLVESGSVVTVAMEETVMVEREREVVSNHSGLTVHMPENPAEANVCISCQ